MVDLRPTIDPLLASESEVGDLGSVTGEVRLPTSPVDLYNKQIQKSKRLEKSRN